MCRVGRCAVLVETRMGRAGPFGVLGVFTVVANTLGQVSNLPPSSQKLILAASSGVVSERYLFERLRHCFFVANC